MHAPKACAILYSDLLCKNTCSLTRLHYVLRAHKWKKSQSFKQVNLSDGRSLIKFEWEAQIGLIFNSRCQILNGYYSSPLRFLKVCSTFWSRFSVYIIQDFHVWLLTYFTHCFNWIHFKVFDASNYAIWWLLSKSKRNQNQKRRDKPMRRGH